MSDDSTRVMPALSNPGMPVSDRTMVGGLSGATQQFPAGIGDAYKTQMGGTTTCPICKSTTPIMEAFCGDCGYLLSSAPTEGIEIPSEEAPAAELVDLADGRRYRLRQGVNTVGRQGTDVLATDGTLSRTHARITVETGAIVVEDLGSSNGTKVGDMRIGANQPTPVTPGTPLRFGNWRVVLETPNASGAGAPTIMGGVTMAISTPVGQEPTPADRTLFGLPTESGVTASPTQPLADSAPVGAEAIAILKRQEGPGADISIAEGTITLGRKPGNTVVFQDAYISSRHGEIVTDSAGTYLIDLGSTNGTQVNGRKLAPEERQLLLEGDEIQLGQTRYLFTTVERIGERQEPHPLEPDAFSTDSSQTDLTSFSASSGAQHESPASHDASTPSAPEVNRGEQ